MYWCQDAWNQVTNDTIKHCWNHTKLVKTAQPNADVQDAAFDEELIENDISARMRSLRIKNPMSMEQLLNPPEEDLNMHQLATDEEIVERAQEPEVQGPEEAAADQAAELQMYVAERMSVLRKAIQVVEHYEGHRGDTVNTIGDLRGILSGIRMRWQIEQENTRVQSRIDSFLTEI
ncbi:MAG: hypothetical protein M1816_002421 [Peltula sp. TS41687]|nr:MAG: hypothetical protein M1816_002421 [Peltula sp. TS41687]